MRLQVFVLGLLFACVSAEAQVRVEFPPGPNGGIEFSMPSGNIACTYLPRGGTSVSTTADGLAELSCDRAQPVYTRVVMGERGRVETIANPGEQPCCSDVNQLAYGSAWELPPFRCLSTKDGLTCNRSDKHGFSISRAAIKTY
jgi:hypothetical protein